MRDEANATVAEWIEAVRILSELAAQCALAAATATLSYREPGHSISEIDDRLGSSSDVEDPLLTAHRFVKFYLISAGDCLDSMSKLLPTDYPNLVGSSAIARAAAEHASRSLYLSESGIDYRARMIRTSKLIAASLSEYRSTHDASADHLISNWHRWRSRTSREFQKLPKQPLGSASGLIGRYFSDGALSYEELSRPTHGNAVWLAVTAIQEQKRTAVARIFVMRNAMFATRCIISATNSLASLWGLDLNSIAEGVGGRAGQQNPLNWDKLESGVREVTEIVGSFDERQFIDSRRDPQPRR